MTREREALKLALAALENIYDGFKTSPRAQYTAIVAIKEALAESEQEPLEYWNAVEGWVKIDEVRKHFETVSCGTIYKTAGEGRVPLYTTPPKREWVGLTLVEVNEIEKNGDFWEDHTPFDFFQAIEAKLKERNEAT